MRSQTMARERHQRKQVEQALWYAESAGCEVEVRHAGHTWGLVIGPKRAAAQGLEYADVAARMIRRFAQKNQEQG
jgi:hypothetical protein